MIEFVHIVTGGIIAYKIKSPLISLPLALVSHFALDLLPHWNPHISEEKKKFGKITKKTFAIIFVDCLAGLIFGLTLAISVFPDFKKSIVILLGCLLGSLPDLIEAPYYFFKQKKSPLQKISKLQGKLQWNVPFIWGILFQAGYLLLLLKLF